MRRGPPSALPALYRRPRRRIEIAPAAKACVSRVMGKLDARDRAQLVVIAYETGLVQPGASL